MGVKSNLSVPERREIVLSLLRREEPAGTLARRHGISENTLYRCLVFCRAVPLGCAGHTATSLGMVHFRAAGGPSDPAQGFFVAAMKVYSKQMRIGLFIVRNLTQNQTDFFHLNPVPRQIRL